MTTVLADPKIPLELVLAVVRAAGRARVRMRLLVLRLLGQVLVLDRDVDPRASHLVDYR